MNINRFVMKHVLMALVMPLMMAFVAMGMVANGQTTTMVTIGGTGNGSTNKLPFNTYNTYSYNQMVYYQTEVGDAGTIGAISFEKVGLSSTTLSELTIWMGHSSATMYSDDSWLEADSLKQVFHAMDYEIPSSEGAVTIVLDSVFEYDGVRDLAICVSQGSANFATGVMFKFSRTEFSSCLYRGDDNDEGYKLHPGENFGELTNERPDISIVKSSSGVFCYPVVNFAVDNIMEDRIDISWDAMVAGNNSYEVVILDTVAEGTNVNQATPISTAATSYSFMNLRANTTYLVAVRSACSNNANSSWTGAYVHTTMMPVEVPYVCDFETETMREQWSLDNEGMTNRWAMDVYASNSYSMYITDGVETPTYGYSTSARGNVFAKTLLHFADSGDYNVGYDWKAMGEDRQDYLRVMLVPAMQGDLIASGRSIHSDFSSETLPEGLIALDDGHKLNLSNEWRRYRNIVTVPHEGNYYLAFLWVNNHQYGENPPAGVDNIIVEPTLCYGLDSVRVTNVGAHEVTINAYSRATSNYKLLYRVAGSERYDSVEMNSPYQLTGLMAGTKYEGVIRAICGSEESYASTAFEFKTNCGVVDLPWMVDAEAEFDKHASGNERFPYCWESIDGGEGRYCWKDATGSRKAHTGNRSIRFDGSPWNVEFDDWLITPKINLEAGTEMTMWVKSEQYSYGSSTGRFAIYVSNANATSALDTANFEVVPVTAVEVANNRDLMSGNHVKVSNAQWRQIKITLPISLSGERYLAFVVKDVMSAEFQIDDIYMYTPSSCASPTNIHFTEVNSESATLAWESEASSVTVYYGEVGMMMNTAMVATSSTGSAVLDGLLPNTVYEYIVVATCSDGVTSTPTMKASFKTMCAAIPNSELPFEEDFSDNETGISGRLDDCWAKGTNSSVAYPYVLTTRENHTPNALFFSGDVMEYCYVALPEFEENVNNLLLSCSVYREESRYGNYSSELLLGLMTNPHDYSTFTAYDTLRPTEVGAWTDFQILMDDYGSESGRYIAFAMPSGVENESFLDNIKVELNGSCDVPDSVEITYVGHNDIEVSWSDSVGSSWVVYYGAPGFDIDTVSSPVAVSNAHSTFITDLNPQTEYEVCVVADCEGGGTSSESLRKICITKCAPIVDLPYTEDFESYATGASEEIDPCWTKDVIGLSSTAYPYPAVGAKINGVRGLWFQSFRNLNTNYYCYAALPKFDEQIINLQLQFNMKSSNMSSTDRIGYSILAVGVMSDPNDISTFDTVSVFDLSAERSGTVRTMEVAFNNYQGEGEYIALMAPDVELGNNSFAENRVYVDDIEVNLIPQCQRPSHFNAVVDINTADLSWEGNSNSYEVKYSRNADMSDSTVITVTGNTVQLTNLIANSHYYINVRAICDDGGFSDWMWQPAKIRTLMDCGAGYRFISDTIGDGMMEHSLYSLNGSSNYVYATTWNIFTREEMEDMGLLSGDNKIRSLALHAKNVGQPVTFRIYMKEDSVAEFNNDLSNVTPLIQMSLVYDGVMQFEEEAWNEIVFNTPFQYHDSTNLVVVFERIMELSSTTNFYYTTGTENRTAYRCNNRYSITEDISANRGNVIFNICTGVPNCIRPFDVVASQITSTSAQLNWTGSAAEYQVVYTPTMLSPDELTLDASNSVIENANQVTLQHLHPNYTYNIYVRSICGADTSEWARTIQFTTSCGVFPLPYVENFDSYRAADYERTMNACWTLGENGTHTVGIFPMIKEGNAASAPNCFEFNSTPSAYSYAALPKFNKSVSELTMKFKLKKMTEAYGTLYIGVMTDPNNIATFEHLTTIQPQTVGVWEEFEVSLGEYNGLGEYIAFKSTDSIYSYTMMDDLEVFEIPTCMAPSDVTITATTGSSAIVSWTDRVTAPAGYVLEYGPRGFELGTGDSVESTTNPTTISGLNPGSYYDVYVKTKCSENSTSRWSIPTSFATECMPMGLPAIYNFDAMEAGDEVPLPLCFSKYNDAQLPDDQKYPYINLTTIFSHSESHYIYFAMGTSEGQATKEAFIFPAIDTINFPMNHNQMTLWARCGNNPAKIKVGIMTDPSNIATFTAIDTLELTRTYTEYIVTFDGYQGRGIYPAIMTTATNNPFSVYVDDVTIETIPTCPRAFDLEALHVTGTTATIDWTDSGHPSKWAVSYQGEDEHIAHQVVAYQKPYTITGLDNLTSYSFNVRPICGDGDTAIPAVSNGTFRTILPPATVPYAYDFEEAGESTRWMTSINDPMVRWYRGTAVPLTQGSYAMYVSADGGQSCSTDWEDIYNSVVYRDIDFGTDTGSYTLTFKAKVGGTQDYEEYIGTDIYEGLYVMLENPLKEMTPSDSPRVSPWGDPDTLESVLMHLRMNVPWRTYSVTLDSVSGIQRLAFYWCNYMTGFMGCTTTDIACAIDSIVISAQSCQHPYGLNVTELESNSATLNWGGTSANYEVYYRPMIGVSSPTVQMVHGNSLALTNLHSNTEYQFRVRAICGVGDTSVWSEDFSFRTECVPYIAGNVVREDFSEIETDVRYDEAGNLPPCWDAYSDGIAPHVIDSSSYWYSQEGASLVMTAGNTSHYGQQPIVRLPYTIEPVNTLTVSYWMCTEDSRHGQLEVGYLTGTDYDNDFVTIRRIQASAATKHRAINGEQGDTVGYFDTVSFANAPADAIAIAFRWVHRDGGYYSVCLDDVEITSDLNCKIPTLTNFSIGNDSIMIEWQGAASEYELLIKEQNEVDWGTSISTTDTHYTFRNLEPNTEYNIKLRALCSEELHSLWYETGYTTHEISCLVPTHLVAEAEYDKVTLSWSDEGDAHRWVVNLFDAVENRMDTVTSNPATLWHLYNALTYNVSIKSLCSATTSSEWSDTIQFTTKTCPIVTGVAVSEITEHSAVLSWSGAEAIQWDIRYGEDIDLNSGNEATATEPQYQLSGLNPHTSYDVYVRGYCTASTFGQWSDCFTFTTKGSVEGIDGVEGNFAFSIYPNPTSGSTTISLKGIEGRVAIHVVDMNGRILVSETLECGIECEKRMDVAGLAQGTYFIHLLGDEINSVRKLVVR